MTEKNTPEPWACCSMHDRSGRRGIWYRVSGGVLEVCAGREGDDDYVRLAVGESLTERHLTALAECLRVGAWMIEESHESAVFAAAREREKSSEAVDWSAVSDEAERRPHQLGDDGRMKYAERRWHSEGSK